VTISGRLILPTVPALLSEWSDLRFGQLHGCPRLSGPRLLRQSTAGECQPTIRDRTAHHPPGSDHSLFATASGRVVSILWITTTIVVSGISACASPWGAASPCVSDLRKTATAVAFTQQWKQERNATKPALNLAPFTRILSYPPLLPCSAIAESRTPCCSRTRKRAMKLHAAVWQVAGDRCRVPCENPKRQNPNAKQRMISHQTHESREKGIGCN
jgi:hypothetical protein